MDLKVKRLSEDVPLPSYQSPGAAGVDLITTEDIEMMPGGYAIAKTGLCVEIPEGYEGTVRGRSGLAFKHGVMVPHIGTIDSDYRGEILVLLKFDAYPIWALVDRLTNPKPVSIKIPKGERIAQLVVSPVARCNIVEGELSETSRGEQGFGSTGAK